MLLGFDLYPIKELRTLVDLKRWMLQVKEKLQSMKDGKGKQNLMVAESYEFVFDSIISLIENLYEPMSESLAPLTMNIRRLVVGLIENYILEEVQRRIAKVEIDIRAIGQGETERLMRLSAIKSAYGYVYNLLFQILSR